jgi:hypothetical protein
MEAASLYAFAQARQKPVLCFAHIKVDLRFMKLGILISQNEPETVFNALRLAHYSLTQGDAVRIFLVGMGVELDQIDDTKFNVREQAKAERPDGRILPATRLGRPDHL